VNSRFSRYSRTLMHSERLLTPLLPLAIVQRISGTAAFSRKWPWASNSAKRSRALAEFISADMQAAFRPYSFRTTTHLPWKRSSAPSPSTASRGKELSTRRKRSSRNSSPPSPEQVRTERYGRLTLPRPDRRRELHLCIVYTTNSS